MPRTVQDILDHADELFHRSVARPAALRRRDVLDLDDVLRRLVRTDDDLPACADSYQ